MDVNHELAGLPHPALVATHLDLHQVTGSILVINPRYSTLGLAISLDSKTGLTPILPPPLKALSRFPTQFSGWLFMFLKPGMGPPLDLTKAAAASPSFQSVRKLLILKLGI